MGDVPGRDASGGDEGGSVDLSAIENRRKKYNERFAVNAFRHNEEGEAEKISEVMAPREFTDEDKKHLASFTRERDPDWWKALAYDTEKHLARRLENARRRREEMERAQQQAREECLKGGHSWDYAEADYSGEIVCSNCDAHGKVVEDKATGIVLRRAPWWLRVWWFFFGRRRK